MCKIEAYTKMYAVELNMCMYIYIYIYIYASPLRNIDDLSWTLLVQICIFAIRVKIASVIEGSSPCSLFFINYPFGNLLRPVLHMAGQKLTLCISNRKCWWPVLGLARQRLIFYSLNGDRLWHWRLQLLLAFVSKLLLLGFCNCLSWARLAKSLFVTVRMEIPSGP